MIETLKLSSDDAGIAQAAALLQRGELVAFPTETVYGLGADARNGRAVAAIYEAKGRPSFNPLIVHVASLEAAEALVELPLVLRDLAQAFWAGPLTLLAPARPDCGLSELVSAGLPRIAVRVPANPLAVALLEAVGAPIAAPSANPSGQISPTTAAHVLCGLTGKISAVLDGGACSVGLESTILGATDGIPVLLRPGGLPVEIIEQAVGQKVASPARGTIEAPGQLNSHYAPHAFLRLHAENPCKDEAYLAFGNGLDRPNSIDLSPSQNLVEAAANLFAHLRTLDELVERRQLSGIAVAPIPDTGLGLAINDRLHRAAAPRR